MSIESLERKLGWTRSALAFLTPIVGLCLSILSLLLLAKGETTAAGIWMIAAILSERLNK